MYHLYLYWYEKLKVQFILHSFIFKRNACKYFYTGSFYLQDDNCKKNGYAYVTFEKF